MISRIQGNQRIQPGLLDRLIDDGTNPSSYSLSQYRESVLRDLEWLLNTKSRLPAEGLSEFPETESSVLNYGMPDPAGRFNDRDNTLKIGQNIADAIRQFEPRIDPASVRVRLIRPPGSSQPTMLAFEIMGVLWATPAREVLRIRTEIDLETGKCKF